MSWTETCREYPREQT